MTVFWSAIAALALFSVAAVIYPLVRRRAADGPGRGDFDIAVYRDQLKEVERDLERNLLGDIEAEAARTEIKRRILAAAPTDGDPTDAAQTDGPAPAAGGRSVLIAVIAVLVPLGAVALYLYLGIPGLPGVPFAERAAPRPAPVAGGPDRELLASLEAKLKKNPDNMEGWMLLARSYSSMELYGESVRAFGRALGLDPDRPGLRSSYGEAMVMAAGSVVTPQAQGVFAKVLEGEPKDFRARYYLGLAKAQRDDTAGAVQDWVDLVAISPQGSPWISAVEEAIAAAAGDLRIDRNTVKPSPQALEMARSAAA
ncbi:MAG: c-type cytochrome biogenesis protein CcmI, partial [Rhodospirillales bacterium]